MLACAKEKTQAETCKLSQDPQSVDRYQEADRAAIGFFQGRKKPDPWSHRVTQPGFLS
jgi:hypothetical protein